MTKIKWGALVVDGRGKLGGHVLSKNRSGSYMRTKVTPSNPRTAAQQTARQRLGVFSTGWSQLTEPQRTAWNESVGDFAKTNVFGDSTNPTGKNLYTRLNVNLDIVGLAPIVSPPLPDTFPPLNILGFTIEIQDEVEPTPDVFLAQVDLQNIQDATNHMLVVEATPPLSPGIDNANNQFRILEIIDPGDLVDETIVLTTSYAAKYGVPAVGRKVFVRFYLVSSTSGQASVPVKQGEIVAQA